MKKLILLFAVALSCVHLQAQNVEGQIIAAQYGEFQVPSVGTGFSFPPASCQIPGGGKNFPAFTAGVPIKIVDDNPAQIEVVTPVAVFITQSNCSVSMSTTYQHTSFYLTSGTGGLQEAISNGLQRTGGPNTIILNAEWYALVAPSNPATVISSVAGSTKLGLVDVTTTPYTTYSWNGSTYIQNTSGGGGGVIPATGLVLKGSGTIGVSVAAMPGTDYVIPSGTVANLSGTPALPNGTTATTQSPGDNTTKLATDAFVAANGATGPAGGALSGTYPNPLVTGTITPKVSNGISHSEGYAGSTVDVRVNACLSDAVNLTNGNTTGVCDARAETGNQTVANEIDEGNVSGTKATLLVPGNAIWSMTVSNTAKCGLRMYKNTRLLGDNTYGTFKFVAPSTYSGAGYQSIMCTDNTIYGGLDIENVLFENEGVAATSGHGVDIEDLFDSAFFLNLGMVDHEAETAVYTKGLCCGDTFINLGVDCSDFSGCTPMVMDASSASSSSEQGVALYSPALKHPGVGLHCLVIQDTRTPPASAVDIYSQYSEGNTADTTTSCDYFNGTGRVGVHGLLFNYGDNASTAPAIEYNYSGSQVPQITADNVSIFNAVTYPVVSAIKNDVTSAVVASDSHGFVPGVFNGTVIPASQTLAYLAGTQTFTNTNTFSNPPLFSNATNVFNLGNGSSSVVNCGAGRSGANQGVCDFQLQNPTAATSGQNYNAPGISVQGTFWNSSVTTNLGILQQLTFASGANPAATYQFSALGADSGGITYAFDNPIKATSIIDSGISGSTQCVQANSAGQLSGTGAACGSGGGSGAWSSLTSPTGALSLAMAAFQSSFTYNAATGTSDLFKLTDTASNTGTGIMFHVTTASGSTEVPWQADANGVGWQVSDTGNLVSTNATANAAITFNAGSGGASSCPSAVSGTSFLCTNAANGISYSNNGAAYTPLNGQAIPYTITASSTPAVNMNNGTVQTITLSANATATVSNITAGVSLTIQICQPASGGPYTWAWPAAIHGGITIGTMASTCSMQEFRSFNGTTFVPLSSGAINVAP